MKLFVFLYVLFSVQLRILLIFQINVYLDLINKILIIENCLNNHFSFDFDFVLFTFFISHPSSIISSQLIIDTASINLVSNVLNSHTFVSQSVVCFCSIFHKSYELLF